MDGEFLHCFIKLSLRAVELWEWNFVKIVLIFLMYFKVEDFNCRLLIWFFTNLPFALGLNISWTYFIWSVVDLWHRTGPAAQLLKARKTDQEMEILDMTYNSKILLCNVIKKLNGYRFVKSYSNIKPNQVGTY